MYIVIRSANGRTETVTLPFATLADSNALMSYYHSRGFIIVEIGPLAVSL
jgi:hypothetical protein